MLCPRLGVGGLLGHGLCSYLGLRQFPISLIQPPLKPPPPPPSVLWHVHHNFQRPQNLHSLKVDAA